MSAKRILLLTMAKMALADGKVEEAERMLLQPLVELYGSDDDEKQAVFVVMQTMTRSTHNKLP